MLLVRELELARVVEHEEFLGEELVLVVADGAELDLHDDLEVGRHHRHAAEERLQVLGQGLAAGVARVHRDEVADGAVQAHVLRVAGELEEEAARLLRVLDRQDLLRDDGQHGQADAVELVEAAPEAALAEALEDLGAIFIRHLVAAVRDDDEDAERRAEVLDRLRLARARGPRGRAAEAHVQGLGERDVAAVRERRDDEALLGAEVLVLVREVRVGDGDDARAVVRRLVGAVVAPVEPRLLRPLEVVGVLDLLALEAVEHLLGDVLLVHVDRHERLDLLPVHLGSTRVIQRRLNVSVPRARVTRNTSTRRGRSER